MGAPVIDGSEVPRSPELPAHQFQFATFVPAQPPKPSPPPCAPDVLPPPPSLAHTFQFCAQSFVTPPPPAPIKPRPLYYDFLPGPPATAHAIPFFFPSSFNTVGAGSFPAYGPSGAATFALSLEPGTKITYSWGTDIFTSYSGKEQRINTTGPYPRQRIEGAAFLVESSSRDLRGSFQRAASSGSTFLLALPHEEIVTTADSISQTITVASTASADWAIVTQRVLLISPDETTLAAVIQAVTATTIRLDVTPGSIGRRGARIMPLIQVLLDPQQGFSRYPVGVDIWSVRCMANVFGWVGQDIMGKGAQIVTYAGGLINATSLTEDDLIIWDRVNEIDGTASEAMDSRTELIDLGALPFAAGAADVPDWQRPIRYSSNSLGDWQWFKAFVRHTLGRQKAFALSTNRDDLVLVSTAGSLLTVEDDGDYVSWYDSLAHRLLALTKTDGSVQYVGVGSLTDNEDGTLTLGLDRIVSGTVSHISFLEIVRFDNNDSDEFSVTWDGGTFSLDLAARTVQEAVVTPVALPLPPLIVTFGDSQIPGNAATDSADPAFNAAATQPTTFVWNYTKHYALSASDPISYETDVSGGVQPDHVGGGRGMSMAIAMGQVFTAAQLTCAIAEFGIFGLACAQSLPTSTYPTTGPNVLSQFITRMRGLEASLGAAVKIILLSEGNNDGANSTNANALDTNSGTLEAALLAVWPTARIIWIKINADTVNASGFTEEGTCITKQAAFFAANPSIIPIHNDDCALQSDHAHFTADTALTVGQRVAFAALDLLGIARRRPSTFAAVLGFGPQTFSAGTSMSPHSWGGALAGDLEILVRVSLTASGTSNDFVATTPAGWTLIDTTTSATGGATTRAAFYQRTVDASMLSTNHGNTAPTTVAAANSNEFSQILTIRGTNPAVPPTIEASGLSKNDAFGTSLAFATGLSSLGANRKIALITVGFRTNATSNPVTITAPNLTNGTVVKNGTRDSGLSNFCTIDVQEFELATTGPVGSPTATLTLPTIAIGGVFVLTH